MNWEAVFFDFDGVILDSVDIKTIAFESMFKSFGPAVQQEVTRYHLENGGVSRFDKFRYYYENILNIVISEDKIQDLSKKFSELVVQGVIESPFIKGAFETLELTKTKGISAYVVSGTPQEEIDFIVRQKDLLKYFAEIHGSPRKKWDIISEILDRKKYIPNRCLFIGDAMSDYEAARRTGTQFLGIVSDKSNVPFPEGTAVSEYVYVGDSNDFERP